MEEELKSPIFPRNFFHLEKPVLEAHEHIKQIDHDIKNMPQDKGPTKDLTPPGELRIRHPFTRNQMIEILKAEKAELQAKTTDMVEKAVVGADKKDAEFVRYKTDQVLHPKENEPGLETEKAIPKDMQQSQDYLRDFKLKAFEKDNSSDFNDNAFDVSIEKNDFEPER